MTQEVLAQYSIISDEDSAVARSMNETALRTLHGCTAFRHETQYSIETNITKLRTIGFVHTNPPAEKMTLKDLGRMAALGVRKVMLTDQSADELIETLKGHYRPDLPDPNFSPNQIGHLFGMDIFREGWSK